mmetsp:Transcript_101609/g.287914  ORF Transcript_101609/g.287914 Transcript_101609/m.287914 type:complete len:206 (+) Transcript_101609:1026-1643(+)
MAGVLVVARRAELRDRLLGREQARLQQLEGGRRLREEVREHESHGAEARPDGDGGEATRVDGRVVAEDNTAVVTARPVPDTVSALHHLVHTEIGIKAYDFDDMVNVFEDFAVGQHSGSHLEALHLGMDDSCLPKIHSKEGHVSDAPSCVLLYGCNCALRVCNDREAIPGVHPNHVICISQCPEDHCGCGSRGALVYPPAYKARQH